MRFVVAVAVVLASLILGSQGQFLEADCGTGSNSPWLVRIKGPNYSCGGSLITNRFVMTAAHCAHPPTNRLTVRVAGSTFNVVSVTKHPRYTNTYRLLKNDIALIKLERAVQFNAKTYIPFPQLKQLVESTQQFKLTYWNMLSDELKTGSVRRLREEVCIRDHDLPIGPNTMCGQSSHFEMDVGTGGSPLSIQTNVGGHQRVVQVGFPSIGSNSYSGPIVYTDILFSSDWIASVVLNHDKYDIIDLSKQ